MMTKKKPILSLFCLLAILLSSCSGGNATILNNLEEREANIVIVFLESKGIIASKNKAASTGAGGGESSVPKFNIQVRSESSVEAMAILNQNGLPQRHGTTLLELFASGGFMTSERENEIRYQAGLAQQLTNIILQIDGVISADVQLSIPETNVEEQGQSTAVTTAAVFVKHQGIFDDPNSHLVSKIQRLIAGSVQGLSIDDVTVVSDRSRFTDVSPMDSLRESQKARASEQVKIWSITMNKDSITKFRTFFFILTGAIIFLSLLLGFIIWKVYPVIKEYGGFSRILNPLPYAQKKKQAALAEQEVEQNQVFSAEEEPPAEQ